MISTPQEIEQTAVSIANWVAYRGPFVLPTDSNGKVYLCVLTEEQYAELTAPRTTEEPQPQTASETEV